MKKTQEEFIKEAIDKFPELDFSKSIYKGCKEKVEVGCKHGYWWVRPNDLLTGGHISCKECAREKKIKTNVEKYGVPYPLLSSEIREKADKICIEKYGTK